MRHILFALIAVFGLGQSLPAQEAPNPEIEATIQNQIDAFLQDDVATAFEYAAPSIQGMFGTPERFGMMVERGYPMVWRPDDVRFGELRSEGPAMAQRVIIRDRDGQSHVLEYRMIDQDGQWRIGGVRILPQPGLAA